MILQTLNDKHQDNKKALSVLIDPDKTHPGSNIEELIQLCVSLHIDYILVGGSLLITNYLRDTIGFIKKACNLPVVLFPGSSLHIEKNADAILLLSLISGRNPDLLIGQHVLAAPILKDSDLEIVPTGYILIGSTSATTVSYISQTSPIPAKKPEIAACTAMAGEMLGLKVMYLDAGSDPAQEVPEQMIREVRNSVNVPLVVGGGIDDSNKVKSAFEAGADMIVLGTAIENDMSFLYDAAKIRDQLNA
jgi:putative glycerol-1-phosphate prenyltransferase